MELASQARRLSHRLGVGLIAGSVAMMSVACTDPTLPDTGHPPQPNQTLNFITEFNTFRQNNTDPNKRPWFCHATGSGEHQHHANNGVVQGPDYPVPAEYEGLERGNLSWADCEQVAGYLEAAKNYAMQHPTLASAERAGFRKTVQYLPGMGTHHQSLSMGSGFNPRQPNTLQYDGDGPEARLIGMSWLVRGVGGNPPAGFPGTNDVWHRHEYLCYNGAGDVVGNNLRTSADCRAAGGSFNMGPLGLWMVHAWIVPNWQYQTDVHGGMHPCLKESGPAAAGDECWAHAQHDHSIGGGGHDH